MYLEPGPHFQGSCVEPASQRRPHHLVSTGTWGAASPVQSWGDRTCSGPHSRRSSLGASVFSPSAVTIMPSPILKRDSRCVPESHPQGGWG